MPPGHTLQVMEYLQDHGAEPAFWAVEGVSRHDDAIAVAATAQRGGRRARCLVGGRDAPYDELQHWMQVAAPIPGWAGFAIGRSIWWAPLRHLSTAVRLGAVSATTTWNAPATISMPGRGRCPPTLIRCRDGYGRAR